MGVEEDDSGMFNMMDLLQTLDLSHERSGYREYKQEDRPNKCVCNKQTTNAHDCKVFGTFRCSKCHNSWSSGNSWYDWRRQRLLTQECKSCNTPNMPVTYHRLRISQSEREGPPHRRDLCAKCKQLGRDCSKQGPSQPLRFGRR